MIRKLKILHFLFILFCYPSVSYGQGDSLRIQVYGKITGNNRLGLSNLMIVNKTTHSGIFGDSDGSFSIAIGKTDTLLIGATGYSTKKISFRDSIIKPEYHIMIRLNKIELDLQPVEIFAKRDLEQIQKDIEKLGYKESDYRLSGVDAFNSPITFLYQEFSKRERSKRWVAEKVNEDNRRNLLKELFRKYVDNEIINLTEAEFDDFINFCNVSDEFMKKSTQYDFIMYIKKKYELYHLARK